MDENQHQSQPAAVEETTAEAPSVKEKIQEAAKAAIPNPNEVQAGGVVPQGEKTLAALGYLSFLCVLPLALKPKSAFCQFHGKQAMVLVILFFLMSLITFLAGMVNLGSFFGSLFTIAQIVLIVLGAMNAAQGRMWRIPFVAQVADKLSWDD